MRLMTAWTVVLVLIVAGAGGTAAQEASQRTDAGTDGDEPTAPDQIAGIDAEDDDVLAALRIRVTGGAVLFNGRPRLVVKESNSDGGVRTATVESPQYSQAATYLAFEAQPRLWPIRRQGAGSCHGEGRCRGDGCCHDDRRCHDGCRYPRYSRWYLDPLLAIRLTTVPVLPGDAAMVLAGDGDASASSSTDASSTVDVTKGLDRFVTSQKAAQVQLGGVLSVNFGEFEVGASRFHWATGVTGRFIVDSIADAQRSRRVWDFDDDLYTAWTVGVRLALYGTKDYRRGWIPSAHLDVSWGSFESFRIPTGGASDAARECLKRPDVCLGSGRLPSANEFSYSNHVNGRWYIEGRMFLKPLYFGFDINNGAGPDDMRFSAGVAMNVSDYFTRAAAAN